MQAAILKPGRTDPSSKPVHTTETCTAALPATGYVLLPVASAVCGVAKSTIWAWTAQGRFPKPVKLSPRGNAWPVTAVPAWLADPVAWQAANKMEG